MGTRKIMLAGSLAGFALLASACSLDVERNADGSLGVDAVMTEASIEAEIERNPQNETATVDIADGAMVVQVDRIERNGTEATVTFRADIGLRDGELVVAVSDAEYDGFAIPQSLVDVWNAELAQAIERASNRHPDASLVSITLDDGQIVSEWRLETPDSRGG